MQKKLKYKFKISAILVFLILTGCAVEDFPEKGVVTQQSDFEIHSKKIPFSEIKQI